ncbi:uncharacterized protein METZ01_LOCUS17837 [marine metagenome]|uniref:LTD domain-containing protein n=1 Tax=marine metagenome TaxID=408172 RepID=A0A381PHQ1_9ZZZZ
MVRGGSYRISGIKVPVVLVLLIGIFVLACSTVTPVPAEPTPSIDATAVVEPILDIDATVEARLAYERAVDATVQAKVFGTLSAPEPKTPSTTQALCKLTGGEMVQSGWTGKDTGNNPCNSCFCTNGVLGCTKMACPARGVSPDSKPVPTPQIAPTSKPLAITNTPYPPPTSTPTSVPTATSVPTPTPRPTPTYTPQPTPTPTPTPNSSIEGFSIYFIDVGQGDATLVVSNDGHSLLVDGGRSKTRIRDRLSALGIQDIDAIAATHPDADHIAGLTEVLAMYKVENVYLNGGQSSTATHADFLDAVEQEGAIVSTLQMNDTFNLGAMVIKVLHPYQLTGDSNVDSLVLQLGCGDVQVLLTGDSEIESEQSMLSENVLQDIDLLKVGHHGSRSSTSQAFLDVIQPEVGVISAGFDSQYGHPHVEVVNRLNAEGVQIFETDTTEAYDDTLKMTSNCQTYEIGGQVFVPVSSGASPIGGNVSPTATPTALPTPVPTPIATPTPMPTPTIVATSTGTSNLSIDCIFFDGVVSRTESDEYVRIVNAGETSVDLSNWSLKDVADGSPTFTFPGYTIAPNETIRVYTNEVHSESGGFSFGLGSSIWANSAPDTAALFNAEGQEVSRKSYPPSC